MSKFEEWLKLVGASAAGHSEQPIPEMPPLAPDASVDIPYGIAEPVLNKTTGKPVKSGAMQPPKPLVTNREVAAGVARTRAILNDSGYGAWVSDAQIEHLVTMVLVDAAKARG